MDHSTERSYFRNVERICRQGLTGYTPHTITNPAKLRRELTRVQSLGYAVDNTEHQPRLYQRKEFPCTNTSTASSPP